MNACTSRDNICQHVGELRHSGLILHSHYIEVYVRLGDLIPRWRFKGHREDDISKLLKQLKLVSIFGSP